MVKLTSTNGKVQYNQDEWVVDTVADLEKIPKDYGGSGMGSTAFVIETSQVYMMNGEGKWVEI